MTGSCHRRSARTETPRCPRPWSPANRAAHDRARSRHWLTREEKGADDKILAVNVGDPAVTDYTHFHELPPHVTREIQRFFQDYKVLEGKEVDQILGRDDALAALQEALDLYRFTYRRP
jgi:hypothetical protein